MKVNIVGPNLLDQSKGDIHVHLVGCPHRRQAQYRNFRDDFKFVYEIEGRADVAAAVYCPSDFEYDIEDDNEVEAHLGGVWFAPCLDGVESLKPAKSHQGGTRAGYVVIPEGVTLAKFEGDPKGSCQVKVGETILGTVYREGTVENPRWFAIPGEVLLATFVKPKNTLWTRKEAIEALTSQLVASVQAA